MSPFSQTVKKILVLALPISTSFLAMALMGTVDTMIVGNYNTDQLAYMGIANSIFLLLFTIPVGLLQGVLIKSSQKFGAKKFASCGKIYNEGKRYLVILAVIFTIIGMNGEKILTLFGQTADMASHGGSILRIFAFSIPFILIYVNANFFLQSIKRPYVAMYAAIVANIVNIMINPVLVYGMLFFPEMGAQGSATSTLIVRIFLAIFMLLYIRRMKNNPKLNKRFGLSRQYGTWWNDSKTTRMVGYGIAITTTSTNGSFSAVNNFAGWLGAETMAVFIILMSVSGLIFMLCFSVSQATSILVANAYGRKNREEIILTTKAGFSILVVIAIAIAYLLFLFPKQIYGIFTEDIAVINGLEAILIYAVFQIFIDILPLSIVGSLYGRGDVKIPTLFQAISYLGVRIASCYLLAFKFELGLRGLIMGLAVGALCSFILNVSRYIYISRKPL